MIRIIFVIIITLHAFIHLMGFVKAFQIADLNQLAISINKSTGLLWLFAFLLFVITVVALLLKKEWWWIAGFISVILSQFLIILYWKDAKYGTIINAIVLLGIILGFGQSNFNSMIKNELEQFLQKSHKKNIITKDMIAHLPAVVQKWLEHSNIIGKDFIYTVHLYQTGVMRTNLNGKWMNFNAEQWFKTEEPGFIWKADVKVAPGIFLSGRDKFENGKGNMLIKLLSIINVVDAKGKEIDHAAMVRYLSEIVWFPSAALSNFIQWKQIDLYSAEAVMNYGGINVSGIFKFNADYDIISFEAKRYFNRKTGATLEDWLIQIEPTGYKEFYGIRIPGVASVTWKLKEGDFTWLRLQITDINYN